MWFTVAVTITPSEMMKSAAWSPVMLVVYAGAYLGYHAT